jgi:hypothetical protein
MPDVAGLPGARPLLWRAVALAAGAVVAWLVFTAYTQPEFILDVASLRLC